MARVSIGGAIAASFAYLPTAWRRAPGIMAIAVAVSAGGAWLQQGSGRDGLTSLLLLLVGVFVGAAAIGALLRIGLEGNHPRDPDFEAHIGGLQWGATEWRVLGATLLAGLLFSIVGAIVFFAWAVALGLSTMGHTESLSALSNATNQQQVLMAFLGLMVGPGGIATAAILIPAFAALLYCTARVSLFTVQTVDTRSFNLGKAWSLSAGAIWALLLATVVFFVLAAILGGVAGAAMSVMASATGHVGQGGQWGQVAGQGLGAAINAPLFCGLQLYVYRAKVGAESVADAFA